MPETISQEYGLGQYFLRGLSREMQHMAAGPGELCSPCEPCSCGAQEDASLRCFSSKFWCSRKEKQGLVSVSGCKHSSMVFPTAAVELSVWPVCLAPFLSKLWKSCWKLMLLLLLSFFSFPVFFSLVLHMDVGRERASGESRRVLQKDCSSSHLCYREKGCSGLGCLGMQQGPGLQQIQQFSQLPTSVLTVCW